MLTPCSVADHGFGSGSSREDAVRALQGAGVEAVIAKGFAFICKFQP
jgi:homoaconitate hydratase